MNWNKFSQTVHVELSHVALISIIILLKLYYNIIVYNWDYLNYIQCLFMYIFHYFMYICYVHILFVTKYRKEYEFGGRPSGRYNTIMQAFGYSGLYLGLTSVVPQITQSCAAPARKGADFDFCSITISMTEAKVTPWLKNNLSCMFKMNFNFFSLLLKIVELCCRRLYPEKEYHNEGGKSPEYSFRRAENDYQVYFEDIQTVRVLWCIEVYSVVVNTQWEIAVGGFSQRTIVTMKVEYYQIIVSIIELWCVEVYFTLVVAISELAIGIYFLHFQTVVELWCVEGGYIHRNISTMKVKNDQHAVSGMLKMCTKLISYISKQLLDCGVLKFVCIQQISSTVKVANY
ncbi:hypothetical protein VP01_1240g3 [Puccinia sorghi]|uniref:Uncharacterized protein n=1 Tax=Puccinia sorghi TaxID=27349 RepID=A0A0L6VPW8_9BASI|nr:hypothetical protein VP01_1240g3 [Puccinia sorghi]